MTIPQQSGNIFKPMNLTQAEISIILNALKDKPYIEVASLIRKLVEQSANDEIQENERGV